MPSFSAPSSIRVASENHVLRLKITHNLVHGLPSDVVHSVKGRLPKELDVLWLSNIPIVLSGSLDGDDIPADEIACSGLAHHFKTQLKENADRLGLNNVSHPFVDDADGHSKLILAPARPLPDASRPHANLVSLHLSYIWKTIARRGNDADSGHLVKEINPFSPSLYLPAEVLLNRVTEQFLIYHLVNRYPLIFGPWCKRLDLEMAYFPSICHSIVEMMTRSRNSKFLSRYKRLLKITRRQHRFVLQTTVAALSSCADDAVPETSEEGTGMNGLPVLTDEQVLCDGLEQLFRMGVPQRRFKPAARVTPHFLSSPQNDDDNMLQCVPDEGVGDDSWIELPEIAMSPCALGAGSSDVDVFDFAQEDWPEGEMWRLDEADVGLGQCSYAAQSDKSLICGSISLAGITTRSPQADPIALYHHQGDDDDGELDPASSGLRYKVSQLACLEDPGDSAVFANVTRDQYYSEDEEQVMCRDDAEWFQTLEYWSDRDEVTDSDSILELHVPDRAEVTNFDEALV